MLGLRYGSDEAAKVTEIWMHAIARSAYLASVDLAQEKGAFPLFDAKGFLASGNMAHMDDDVREAIAHAWHPQCAADLGGADGDDFALCGQRQFGDRAGLCLCLYPQGAAKGRQPRPKRRWSITPCGCGARSSAMRPCPSISSTPRPCRRWTMCGCRRRRRNGWIPAFPRPSTARRISALTISSRSIWRPGIRAAKAARPIVRMM